LIVPGFVDLHIHGALGIDFMTASRRDMETLCDHLEAVGYEAFLPTTVAASADDVLVALSNLPDRASVAGFHLEGPFIAPEHPGAQPRESIVDYPATASEWDAVLDDPRLRIVTLAPERPRALELVRRLCERGVVVSIGHTHATYDETRYAVEFGASHMTHFFNAMRPFHHREPGPVGYGLVNPGLITEVIADGRHVAAEALGLLLKTRPIDRVIAVSDATAAAGLNPGTRLDLWGRAATIERGEVRLADGTLAGSAITLLDAFRWLAETFDEETAARLCCINPRRALGLSGPPRVFVELGGEGKPLAVHRAPSENVE
jgi:N-acetylglucosamine-6-phosphate deacetylase